MNRGYECLAIFCYSKKGYHIDCIFNGFQLIKFAFLALRLVFPPVHHLILAILLLEEVFSFWMFSK